MHRTKFTAAHKAVALLLSFTLLLTAVFGGTFAQLVDQTPSFINTFLSGLDPTGDLTIRKIVEDSFGNTISQIPDNIGFSFTVNLGGDYANQTVETSQGDKQADDYGNITVYIKPGEAAEIRDLPEGMSVTVTETVAEGSGFAVSGDATQTCTITRDGNEIVYTNIYTPAKVSPVNLTVNGTKVLEGRDWQVGDSFTFLLEYKLAGSTDDWQEVGRATVTYELDEEGNPKPDFDKFSFTDLVQDLEFATADTYSFRVSEAEGTIGGVTYGQVSYFDVTVGDADMDGALEILKVKGGSNATAVYDDITDTHNVNVTVNNTYAPAGTPTVTIQINKRVDSQSGEDKTYEGYTFELYDEDGQLFKTSEPTSAAGETSITLTFEATDAGKTFHYTLKETHAGDTINGMVYAATEYKLSVSIVDNLDGTVSAYIYNTEEYSTQLVTEEPEETEPEETEPEETEPEETEPEETEPTETEPAPTETEPTPTETEPEPTETEPEPTETEPEPTETEPIPTETEPAPTETEPAPTETQLIPNGETMPRSSASAPPVVLSDPAPSDPVEDEPDPTEGNTDPTEPENTPATKEITVIPEGAADTYEAYFVNTYDPVDAQVSISGRKVLIGRGLKEGEFRFDLYKTDSSYTVTDGMQPIQSVANDAYGSFTLTDSCSTVGTYYYVVKEDASGALGGVDYDETVYHVKVTVADNNGVLTYSSVIQNNDCDNVTEIIFRNKYKAAGTSVTLTGTKTLNGDTDLPAGTTFKFHLYNANESFTERGELIRTAYSSGSGSFSFGEISYGDDGTYYYVAAEDTSAAVEGMDYDETTYGITVTVTDNGQGQLVASTAVCKTGTGEAAEIIFANSYTKPTEPDPGPIDPDPDPKPTIPTGPTTPSTPADPSRPTVSDSQAYPDTGDHSHVRLYALIMLASFVTIVVLLAVSRYRKKHDHKSR